MDENKIETQEVVNQQAAPQPQEETQKEYNMRVMRQKMAEADARAAAAEQRLMELEKNLRSQQQPQQYETQDADDFNIEDDGYPDNKILKKMYSKFNKEVQKTKEELAQYKARSESESAELRLKAQYSDFDQVVSEENIKRLAIMEPEMYNSLRYNPDLYGKGKTAYNLIKKFELYDKYEAVDRKIDANIAKPKNPSTVSPQNAETPLTKVGDYARRTLTKEQKEFYQRQVDEAKKNRF